MNKEYQDCYKEMLSEFQERFKNFKSYQDKEFLTFGYEHGNQFEKGLLFYGRALAGRGYHTPNWTLNSNNKEQINHIEKQRLKHLDWAILEWEDKAKHGGRSLRKFLFWQAFHSVYKSLFEESTEDSWLNYIAWSNLYKISPVNGKNPTKRERIAQLPKAKELFKLELEQLNPKYAILATGYDWAMPCIEYLGVEVNRIAHPTVNGVVATCTYKDSKIIVTNRPDSRKKGATIKNYLEDILKHKND